MPHANRRQRGSRTDDPMTRSGLRAPRSLPKQSVQTVGDALKINVGREFTAAWLSQALRCSLNAAAELSGYWMPQGPPRLLEQTINVFASALNLDRQRLRALLLNATPLPSNITQQRDTLAPRASGSIPSHQPKIVETQIARLQPPTMAIQPTQLAEISIGSAEGVRVVKQRQPIISYRKSRRFVA